MIAPPNFGHVEDGIYRCGSPDGRSYGFLASLRLKTAILLTDTHDAAFVRFLQECGVNILCPLTSVGTGSHWHARTADGNDGLYAQSAAALAVEQQRQQMLYQQQQQQRPQQQQVWGSPSRQAPVSTAVEATEDAPTGGDRAGTDALGCDLSTGERLPDSVVSPVLGASGAPLAPLASSDLGDGAVTRHSNVARFLRANNTSDRPLRSLLTPVTTSGAGSNGADGFHSALGLYDEGGSSSPAGRGVGLADGAFRFPSGVGLGGTVGPGAGGGQRGLMTLSESVVVDILHVLLDPQYYPVLVTCPMGRYRTGIVCGCLRKLQRWNLVSILEEYRRFAGDKSRAENEDFIELFDKDLVSLELEGGRHPTILYH